VVSPPQEFFDIVFFFKEAHRFEKRKKGCLRDFFKRLNTSLLLVTLPMENMGGRFDLSNKHDKLIEEGLYTKQETEKLRKIIEYRNWVVHDLYEQERQGKFLNDYRNSKLAVTKYLLFEAIDFVNDKIDKMRGRSGVANIINNSYNE